MQFDTFKSKEFTVEKTGLNTIAYKLKSGGVTLDGIRNKKNPDLIVVATQSGKPVGAFIESTMKQVLIGK